MIALENTTGAQWYGYYDEPTPPRSIARTAQTFSNICLGDMYTPVVFISNKNKPQKKETVKINLINRKY